MKIVIGAIVVGMMIFFVSNAGAQEIFLEDNDLYSTKTLTNSMPATVGSKIVIKSAATLRGEITIVTSDQELIKLEYFKKAKTGKKSLAIDYIDLMAVGMERIPDGVKVEIRAPNPAPWTGTEAGMIEATLTIPKYCEVSLDAMFFDVQASGPLKSLVVPASLGRFNVRGVTEQLKLTTSNRRVNVEDVSGNLDVSTTNSTLIAKNIKCVGGTAVFRNDGGDIKIDGVAGEINVKNEYGRIDIERFEPSKGKHYVRGLYAPVVIRIINKLEGQLLVTNGNEDIEISVPSDISAVFSLAVEEGGKIEVSNFPFKPDLVQENRLSIISGDGSALITGSVRGKGNIYLTGINKEGSR